MSEEAGAVTEARIADLEARLAFQEQAIEDLSMTVYRQQQALTALEQRLERVAARAAELADRMPDDGGHQPPPHY